ncbi:SIMPL domain-containing protein [Paracoccus sp. S-4012]|uniref:SIMPL domain-containing protein n=1 Tax=Paracoccus sp. S-4012 TaxID=2665648 RepID=UPI0018A1F4FE|nr:SIMPL domain-containing protein [Paracoccus sp. S-4012]
MTRPQLTLRPTAARLLAPGLALALALGAPASATPGMGGHHGGHGMHGHGGMHHGGQMGHSSPMRGERGQAERGRITVIGEGQASIAPDVAVVSLGVMVQAPTAAEAMAQNAARQQGVFSALEAAGIEARDVQTSGLALNAIQDYSREGGPPVITGYQASNIVTVRVRDLAGLGPVIDGVIGAGANEIQGISFLREDASEAEITARQRAVESARERAEAIAAAAGQRLGRLVSITDQPMPGFGPPQPYIMRAMAADAEASTPVAAGELQVQAQVNAVWELIPMRRDRSRPGEPPRPVGPDGADLGGQPMPLPADPASAAAGDRPAVVTGEPPPGDGMPMRGRMIEVPDWLLGPNPTPPGQ